MKTININLLGSSVSSNANLTTSYSSSVKEDIVGESTKTLSKIIIIASSVLFFGCFCVWSYNLSVIASLKSKISSLTNEYGTLSSEYKELDSLGKALVAERKILEEKLKYQQKIDKDFLPWSKLLADVARAIPQNLVIDQISKQERPDIIGNVNYLEIKGRINQGKSPLQSLSFFILNLNENAKLNSILNNAKASNVKFDDKDSCYTFDLTADIKLPEVKEPQEKKAKG
ncbi:MAG: hypothetical protein WCK67_10795 [bacterium]